MEGRACLGDYSAGVADESEEAERKRRALLHLEERRHLKRREARLEQRVQLPARAGRRWPSACGRRATGHACLALLQPGGTRAQGRGGPEHVVENVPGGRGRRRGRRLGRGRPHEVVERRSDRRRARLRADRRRGGRLVRVGER